MTSSPLKLENVGLEGITDADAQGTWDGPDPDPLVADELALLVDDVSLGLRPKAPGNICCCCCCG